MKLIDLHKVLIEIREKLIQRKIRGGGYIAAGYPAEAYNYIEKGLDLNEYITRGKTTVKCVWATNTHMTGEGIALGDLIVIDTSLKMSGERVGLFWIDDQFCLGRAKIHKKDAEIVPLYEDSQKYIFKSDTPLELKGIVTRVIKKLSVYNHHYAFLPTDAEKIIQDKIDFTEYLVDMWETTFYLWAAGESMIGDGIFPGDLLIIDNLADTNEQSILVFAVDKKFTLKRVKQYQDHNELISSNPDMLPIKINKGDELKRWGVLTAVIKDFLKK